MSKRKPGRLVKLNDGRKGVIYQVDIDAFSVTGKFPVRLLDNRGILTDAKVVKSAAEFTVIGFID